MATNNMHNLTTLIKRLEAATLRLEDIASSTIELPQAVPGLQPASSAAAGPVPKALTTAPAAATTPPPPAPEEPLPESIEDFDSLISGSVGKYVQLSEKIGGVLAEQASMFLKGFQAQRQFLLLTTKAKKPNLSGSEASVYQDLLKPMIDAIIAASGIKDSHRGDPLFNHLSTVADSAMVLAWVSVESKPFKHVESYGGQAQFYANKVLVEYKEKNKLHVEWVHALQQLYRDLTEYVKLHFENGIPWNPKGEPAAQVAKTLSSGSAPKAAPAPSAGGPPPPPPPPPGPPPVLQIMEEDSSARATTPGGTGLSAVFSDLNKGESVTKGLRKVDKSQMTHKNPSLRAGSTVPDKESGSARGKSPAPGKKPKPESMRVKKPAKKELDGNKWMIENYENESLPIEIDASLSHSVLISKCNATTVIIRGKANAVTIENSTRLSLVVDSLVSTVDAVNARDLGLQVMGSVPTVLLDQIDGAQIFLSRESSAAKIFTSKSSNVNINVIGENEDYREIPLPSQMCHFYDPEKGRLVNEIVEHAG